MRLSVLFAAAFPGHIELALSEQSVVGYRKERTKG